MQSPFLSSLRVGLWLLCARPLLVQAGPADEFAAANRAQQAKLLQARAAEPDAARLPLLQGLQQETVAIDGRSAPLSAVAIAICRSRARRHRLAN